MKNEDNDSLKQKENYSNQDEDSGNRLYDDRRRWDNDSQSNFRDNRRFRPNNRFNDFDQGRNGGNNQFQGNRKPFIVDNRPYRNDYSDNWRNGDFGGPNRFNDRSFPDKSFSQNYYPDSRFDNNRNSYQRNDFDSQPQNRFGNRNSFRDFDDRSQNREVTSQPAQKPATLFVYATSQNKTDEAKSPSSFVQSQGVPNKGYEDPENKNLIEETNKIQRYSGFRIPEDLIKPVVRSPPTFNPSHLQATIDGNKTMYVTSDKFILEKFLTRFLESSGNITRCQRLSYSSVSIEFSHHTMAVQGKARMKRMRLFNDRIQHYKPKLVPPEIVLPLYQERENDINTRFDPPRCLIVHKFDKPKDIENFFKPFRCKFIQQEDRVITYHHHMASINDLYSAFNDGKAGLSYTYVTEAVNAAKIREEVYQIIKEKLIEACINDCNQMLIQDLYVHILRRARFFNDVIVPSRMIQRKPVVNQEQPLGKLIHFYLSKNPVSFYLSQPSSNFAIISRMKKASKERKKQLLSEDGEKYTKTILEQMYEITDPIENLKQPQLDGPCSRLSSIKPIKEKHKREYLRPYARARLQPLVVARDSGIKLRQAQFHSISKPVLQLRSLSGMSRGFSGKRVYFEKSTIQGYGLFALETISADSFICEYNGELLRSRVADIREDRYIKMGFPHMYLFRISGDLIIDATMKGNKARFLNHSCHPNCRAKIVNVGKTQAISFYAIRNIKPHDEITFNYLMEFEDKDKRERCYCGAKQCLGYLNYCDDPEIKRQREEQAYMDYLESQEGYS